MARDQETLEVPQSWIELTNVDVTAISFQVLSGIIYVRGTTDTTAPDASAAGFRYSAGEGEANIAITELFNGVGIARVWARALSTGALVHVDTA